jgi:hypothetical protein
LETLMLTDEGDLKDYLGVRIERKGNKTIITQPWIINWCLQFIGWKFDKENRVKTFDTPANPSTILQKTQMENRGGTIWNIV